MNHIERNMTAIHILCAPARKTGSFCICVVWSLVSSSAYSLWILTYRRTEKALIRLRECAVWSGHPLFAYKRSALSHVAHMRYYKSSSNYVYSVFCLRQLGSTVSLSLSPWGHWYVFTDLSFHCSHKRWCYFSIWAVSLEERRHSMCKQ